MRFVRFMILCITTLCLTSILANMNTYNFTKICVNNATDASANYTSSEVSIIQSATAYGSLAASIPLVIALDRLPKRIVFTFAGLISAVATALIPFAETQGFGFFVAARIFQGVGFSTTFPMVGAVTSEWAALTEHGIFLAFLTGFSQLSNIFTMPVAGALCSSSYGWRSVYYINAALGLVLFLIFFLLFRDTPAEHRLVGEKEQKCIAAGRQENSFELRPTVPYKAILFSATIWGVWMAGFADILAIQFANMFSPQYLNEYLHYNIFNSGIMAAVPVIVQWIFKIFAGFSSDMIKFVGERTKLIVFNSIALFLSAGFFIVLSFIPNTEPKLCMAFLIITEGLIGFNTGGFNKCATLHARQHAHFVMLIIMNIQSITILVEPFIGNAILTDNTAGQWRTIFVLHAALLVLANIVFCIFSDAKPAAWTRNEEEEKDNVSTAPSSTKSDPPAYEKADLGTTLYGSASLWDEKKMAPAPAKELDSVGPSCSSA